MRRSLVVALVAICVVLVAPELGLGAVKYTLSGLGTLTGKTSYATAINDQGQIVGNYKTSEAGVPGYYFGFLYSNGQMTDLGAVIPDAINNRGQIVSGNVLIDHGVTTSLGNFSARSINDLGQMAGFVAGSSHAFLYDNGALTDLGTLGGKNSGPVAINNAGQVVGESDLPMGADVRPHGFLYSAGKMIDLDPVGGPYTAPHSINNHGQVVGEISKFGPGGFREPFLYTKGAVTILPANFGDDAAYGINDLGQVVGTMYSLNYRAFLYDNGSIVDLNTLIDPSLGWTLRLANDINNEGQIVGYGIDPGGHEEAFLLTPVPEPAAAAVLLSGLMGLMLRRPAKRGQLSLWIERPA